VIIGKDIKIINN